MSSNDRQDQILKLLNTNDYLTVEELSKALGVSKVTIRSHLTIMEQKGLLFRTHGGAMIPEGKSINRSISNTIREFSKEKEDIARAATQLIADEDIVLTDSGSTCLHLANFLKGKRFTLVSNSLLLIDALKDEESIDIISLGGTLKRSVMGMTGPMAISDVSRIHADILFLGATGYTNSGIFSSNLAEAELKQCMLEVSDKVCFLADYSKYGTKALAHITSWDNIDIFITDQISPELKMSLEQKGVEVIVTSREVDV